MSNEIYHHGILGMKWGVRRTPEQLGHKKSKSSKKTTNWSDDAKNVSELRKKNVHELSNTELKQLNERLNLEKNYRSLNPSAVKRGIAAVAATAALTTPILNLYNNSNQLITIGKKVADKMTNTTFNLILKTKAGVL